MRRLLVLMLSCTLVLLFGDPASAANASVDAKVNGVLKGTAAYNGVESPRKLCALIANSGAGATARARIVLAGQIEAEVVVVAPDNIECTTLISLPDNVNASLRIYWTGTGGATAYNATSFTTGPNRVSGN
jgi:hypothetical protein